MKYLKKYENPDEIHLTEPRDVDTHHKDDDALAFGYLKGKMHISFTETHNQMAGIEKGAEGRKKMKFPGRLWIEQQVISFWKFPTPEQLPKVLKDIKRTYDKLSEDEKYKEIIDYENDTYALVELDFNDPDWLIEILLDKEDEKDIDWDNIENIDRDGIKYTNTKLIPLTEYMGSAERSEEEMGKAHLDWRLKQKMKEKGWGRGWGSDMSKGLAWRQAKYVEGMKYLKTFNNYD